MKVGIVTITELDNFGNRLQNYALQSVLRSLGAEVETLPNYITYRHRRNLTSKANRFLRGCLKHDGRKAEVVKQLRFEAFDRKNFRFSRDCSEINFISPEAGRHFDCFVAGSDQIWNPHFSFNFDFNFLTFAPPEKRVAYAASFGVDAVPEEKQERFAAYLNGMRAISTREYAGSDIVHALTGKACQVMPDPTLLLSPSQWQSLEKKPRWHSAENYILVYHLGTKENQQSVVSQLLDAHPEYRGCGIVNIGDPENVRTFSITPDEFLYLLHHAQLMVTDSFHGTVFSLLFGTPVYYTKRVDNYVSMNSRVQSLFAMLDITLSGDIIDCHVTDREKFEAALAARRKGGLDYLRENVVDYFG